MEQREVGKMSALPGRLPVAVSSVSLYYVPSLSPSISRQQSLEEMAVSVDQTDQTGCPVVRVGQ